MSDVSSHLSLPYIAPSQAQKHVTHNEALRLLDSVVQLSAVSASLTAPPAADEGSRYIVAAGATGAWAGHDGQLAILDTGAWSFLAPRAGWRSWIEDTERMLVFDGSAWRPLGGGIAGGEVAELGIGIAPSAATPFAARLNDALMTAETLAEGGTGDMVLRLNKEDAADDLGLVMQIAYVTRALVGLFGSDGLRISVSADGSSFNDGIAIDTATGIVSQPALPRFVASTNFDNYCAADTWIRLGINAALSNGQGVFDPSTNLFTAPVAGTYAFGATLMFKQNSSSTVKMQGRFLANGTTPLPGSFGEISSSHIDLLTKLSLNSVTELAAGDTVELQGLMRLNDGYFAADLTCFWGYKIG